MDDAGLRLSRTPLLGVRFWSIRTGDAEYGGRGLPVREGGRRRPGRRAAGFSRIVSAARRGGPVHPGKPVALQQMPAVWHVDDNVRAEGDVIFSRYGAS